LPRHPPQGPRLRHQQDEAALQSSSGLITLSHHHCFVQSRFDK
jgi:hypothetical protein